MELGTLRLVPRNSAFQPINQSITSITYENQFLACPGDGSVLAVLKRAGFASLGNYSADRCGNWTASSCGADGQSRAGPAWPAGHDNQFLRGTRNGHERTFGRHVGPGQR